MECAVVLSVAMFVVLAILELGLAAWKHNCLAAAARRLVRTAAVHGAHCPSEVWGPVAVTGTASDASPPAVELQAALTICDPDKVTYSIDWPDADNDPGDVVRVTLEAEEDSTLLSLVLGGPVRLTATAHAQVAH